MRRFAIFWSVLLIFSAAMASYLVSLQVGKRYDRVQTLTKQMRADGEAIRMLETELTYRASPQRLQALIDAHGLKLGLPKADQYLVATANLAPRPGEETAPDVMPVRQPLYADAMPYAPPAPRPAAPVQLASLAVDPHLVAFAEPTVLPAEVRPAAVPPVRAVATETETRVSKESKPARGRPVADDVVQKKNTPRSSATKSVAAEVVKKEKKAAAPKPAAAPDLSARDVSEKTAQAKPAAASADMAKVQSNTKTATSRRLDSALIASIESAAAKEAQKP